MRASQESSTGGVGVTEVAGLFERIGWAPTENRDRHDLGTDLWVAVRDSRRFDRGALIGVQVKGGESWFKEPVTDAHGEVTGWWHRNDSDHFDYWIKHQLPHLLVLYDIDARIGYWTHLTAEGCDGTGKNCKVFVPRTNTVSDHDAPRLLEIALAQRGSISLEGTNFDAASAQISPSDKLRYALLIPRLVAPHPNRSISREIEPEEAIALLVLLHIPRLQEYLEKSGDWPNLNEKPLNNDWRWQFAYGLWRFIAYNDRNYLKEIQSGATREDWRAAAVAVLAAAELSLGALDEGSSLVTIELARDKATPVDHAWLQLHAAHLAAEAGVRDDVRLHASQAISTLASIGDDPTASLLSGIGYRTLFSLATWKESADSISDTLRAGDNAGSWWRDQQLRWALDAAALSQFREWAQDASSRWEAEPPLQQLLPSILMALFSADRGGWAAAEARMGRFGTQYAKTDNEFRLAFMRLLNSGDKSSVLLAGRKAWRFGPARVLAGLSAFCTPPKFTPGRIKALLEFWRAFGDLAPSEVADEVTLWCLHQSVAMKIGEDFLGSSPNISNLLSAIEGALGACSTQVQEKVAADLKSIPVHWTHLKEVCSVAEKLERLVPHALDAQLLFDLADQSPEASELARLLGLSARLGSEAAASRLLCAAQADNLDAAAVAFESGLLTEDIAGQVVQVLVQLLDKEIDDSVKGVTSYGHSVDRSLLLVNLSLTYPPVGKWNSIMAYIGCSAVIADHKVAPVYRIVRDLALLPEEAAKLLPLQIPGLRASRFLPANRFDIRAELRFAAGLADFVQFGLGAQSDQDIEAFISIALATDSGDLLTAWRVLWALRPNGYDTLALQSLCDDDPAIRDAAARFVARRVDDGTDTPALRHAVERICSDGSVLIPHSFVSELSNRCPSWVTSMISPLRDHPSASVRAAVRLVSAPDPVRSPIPSSND